MDAVEFFATHHPAPGCISKELQNLAEQVQVSWESVSVHPLFSLGPVGADEEVCRPHTNPTHYAPGKNELKPTAFDDAFTFGLSVERLKHASLDACIAKAERRVAKANMDRAEDLPQKVVFGYSVFEVKSLRNVQAKADGSKDAPRRGLGVYDTALEGEPEHADVCVLVPKSQGARSARLELFRLGNASHQLV